MLNLNFFVHFFYEEIESFLVNIFSKRVSQRYCFLIPKRWIHNAESHFSSFELKWMRKISFLNLKKLTDNFEILRIDYSRNFTRVNSFGFFESYIAKVKHNRKNFKDSIDFILIEIKFEFLFYLVKFLFIWQARNWIYCWLVKIIVIRSVIFEFVRMLFWRRSPLNKIIKNVVISLSFWYADDSTFLQKIRNNKSAFYFNLCLTVY